MLCQLVRLVNELVKPAMARVFARSFHQFLRQLLEELRKKYLVEIRFLRALFELAQLEQVVIECF